MKNNLIPFAFLALIFLTLNVCSIAQSRGSDNSPPQRPEDYKKPPFEIVDTRIDNMKYWRWAASVGLIPVEPYRDVPPGVYKGSKIKAHAVSREDSPDIPVTNTNTTQSENSIFVNPNNTDHILQSNNSTQNPPGTLYGANYFLSYNSGQTWGGSIYGAGGSNSGDPTTAINLNGRMFVGYISSNYGQGVSYSDNGTNWVAVQCANATGNGILDKNHLWIDNSPTSPYVGNLYNAWTDFYGPNNNNIEFMRSTNAGVSWTNKQNISSAVNAGSHNQGVNIQTGPNGEVYVVWAIYDSWPSDEKAIGFARSLNGGVSFSPATRIINNIRGIRSTGVGKNHRVNSFPSMAVDISGGQYNGHIYVVWANVGVPGVNQGTSVDIYMIKSTNQGQTWSAPIKVNQDPTGLGRKHYFPWITCDPETGTLSVIYYDDRNVGGNKCETWCSVSFDGGETWEDFRVSDVDFTPSPIPGLAQGYMGDYLGIAARGAKVYPVWADNRTGSVMTYVSPFETNNLPRPSNLVASVIFETGQVNLSWNFNYVPGFLNFKIYRNNFLIGTTTGLSYADFLPAYGVYKYKVTAMHVAGESSAVSASVQWGDPQIAVTPMQIIEYIPPQSTSTRYLTVANVGQLDLHFEVSGSTQSNRSPEAYCTPSANCSYGDGLTGFSMGTINNMNSGCSPGGYGNFTNMITDIEMGNTYTVQMKTGYSNQFVCIWIDFNKNEVFENSERILTGFQLQNVNQIYTTQVTIPNGIQGGQTRMRVKAQWQSTPLDPCSNMTYGETEDYSVNVKGWMLVQREKDTLAPGTSRQVEVQFDSNDLTFGTYYGNIKFESNDPDDPIVNVPVTLHVSTFLPLEVNVIAFPPTICAGQSSQLATIVSGGSGNYSYSWTSNPPGFYSTLPNPSVSPQITTTYIVEVNDGTSTATAQAIVVVIQTPSQAATPQGVTSICKGTDQTVFSTNGAPNATNYSWMLQPAQAGTIQGSGLTATVTWNPEYTGLAEIKVRGNNQCGNGIWSNPLQVMIHDLPIVNLGEDMTICAGESVILDAGNPGSTYLWSTGATTQTILVDTTGYGLGQHTFWVQVTNPAGCTSTDEILIEFLDCTGIYNPENPMSVEIYPNPATSKLYVLVTSRRNSQFTLSIVNNLGKKVIELNDLLISTSESIEINLEALPAGVYFLRLDGPEINLSKKIIIQKL